MCSSTSSTDMLLSGSERSHSLAKAGKSLFVQNCVMVWSNALFSHNHIFSSFLTRPPRSYHLWGRLFSVQKGTETSCPVTVCLWPPGVMARDRNANCRTWDWQNTYRKSLSIPTLSHCHCYTETQMVAGDKSLRGKRQCPWRDRRKTD